MKYLKVSVILSFFCTSLSLWSMEEIVEKRSLLVRNETSDVINILAKMNGGNEIEFLLADGELVVIPFRDSVDSFIVQGIGILSGWYGKDFSQDIMVTAVDKPTMDIALQIRPPKQEGFLAGLTSYVKPYVVSVKSIDRINKDEFLIPSSRRVVDVFERVKTSLKKDPSARLKVTDFFGVSPDASTEMLKGKYLYMVEQWEELAELSPNQDVRVFARKVLRILKKASYSR